MDRHCMRCNKLLHKTLYCRNCNLLHLPNCNIKTIQGILINLLKKDNRLLNEDDLFIRLKGNSLNIRLFNSSISYSN